MSKGIHRQLCRYWHLRSPNKKDRIGVTFYARWTVAGKSVQVQIRRHLDEKRTRARALVYSESADRWNVLVNPLPLEKLELRHINLQGNPDDWVPKLYATESQVIMEALLVLQQAGNIEEAKAMVRQSEDRRRAKNS
jgi:hypothetical protein